MIFYTRPKGGQGTRPAEAEVLTVEGSLGDTPVLNRVPVWAVIGLVIILMTGGLIAFAIGWDDGAVGLLQLLTAVVTGSLGLYVGETSAIRGGM